MMVVVTRGTGLTIALGFIREGAIDLGLEILERNLEWGRVKEARDYLRKRQRPLALELLEAELDRHTVALGRLAGQVKPQDHKIVVETLRSIREYRQRHPRRYEADLGYFDERSLANTRVLWDEAERVLDGIY